MTEMQPDPPPHGPSALDAGPGSAARAPTVTTTDRGWVIWHDPALAVSADLFDPDTLAAQGKIIGRSTGRRSAWFLRDQGQDMVLRHYWRGGAVGRVNPDLFLRRPVAQSRPMQEYALLDWMHGQGLPVPRPLAACYRPAHGLLYRADLITRAIPGARPLAERLAEGPLDIPTWSLIGECIGRMHRAGVDHSDLNCRNILLQADATPWLIDFDKSRRRDDDAFSTGNLDRLARSLRKEAAKGTGMAWDQAGWDALIDGHHRALTGRDGRP